MSNERSALDLSISYTILFILLSGILGVLALFDLNLGWDLFSPRIEAVLTAILASVITAAGVGIVVSALLGAQEGARTQRLGLLQLQRSLDVSSSPVPFETPELPLTRRGIQIGRGICWAFAISAAIVLTLSGVERYVRAGRLEIYHRLSAEQATSINEALADALGEHASPRVDHVPKAIYSILRSLEALEFIDTATLFVRDRTEPNVMWGYRAWNSSYDVADGFARFIALKRFERSMLAALADRQDTLDQLNRVSDFVHYQLVRSASGTPLAVLRLDANEETDLRAY